MLDKLTLEKIARGQPLNDQEQRAYLDFLVSLQGTDSSLGGKQLFSGPTIVDGLIKFPLKSAMKTPIKLEVAKSEIVVDIQGFNDYAHLLIMGQVRSTDSGTGAYVYGNFNDDTTAANYVTQRILGIDAAVSAFYAATSQGVHVGTAAESGAAAGESGAFVCFIPHYKSGYFKYVLTLAGLITSAPLHSLVAWADLWRSTAEIQKIKFTVTSPGNIDVGSLISVFGVSG